MTRERVSGVGRPSLRLPRVIDFSKCTAALSPPFDRRHLGPTLGRGWHFEHSEAPVLPFTSKAGFERLFSTLGLPFACVVFVTWPAGRKELSGQMSVQPDGSSLTTHEMHHTRRRVHRLVKMIVRYDTILKSPKVKHAFGRND